MNAKQNQAKSYAKKEDFVVEKRKTDICYYVMKLAEFGELYSFIEHNEAPFTERMTRYILD